MKQAEFRLAVPHDAPSDEEARLDRMLEGFSGLVESIVHRHGGEVTTVARYKKKKAPPPGPDGRTG